MELTHNCKVRNKTQLFKLFGTRSEMELFMKFINEKRTIKGIVKRLKNKYIKNSNVGKI